MTKHDIHEFLITVFAVMVGLVAGKFLSQLLAKTGVPISSNDPLIVSLPPVATAIPSPVIANVVNANTPAAMNSAGGN